MFKPMLFNTEMVKAILDGRKTQTRRLIKTTDGVTLSEHSDTAARRFISMSNAVRKAPCETGDILWVRETWSTHYDGIHDNLQFCYRADDIDLKSECLPGESNRWWPSIHMPKEAARIFMRVKDVRTERLRDMNDSDLANEGFCDWIRFISLWNSTVKADDCGSYDWNANPWVWVIEFERIEKPEGWPKA